MVHFQAVLLCELELNFTSLVMNDFAELKDTVSVWICKKCIWKVCILQIHNPKFYLVLFFSFHIVLTNFLISFQTFMARAAEM